MSEANYVLAGLSAVPGVLGLAAALVGYGKLMQRLDTVERDVDDVKDLKTQVGRIDERTKNTDKNVDDIKGDLGRLTEHFLSEGRAFPEREPRRRSR